MPTSYTVRKGMEAKEPPGATRVRIMSDPELKTAIVLATVLTVKIIHPTSDPARI